MRRILDHEPPAQVSGAAANQAEDDGLVQVKPERRYRARREFDDIDKAEFRESAFKTIRAYFQSAIQELDSVEGLRGRFTDYSDTSFGCVIVNRGLGRGTAHLTVHCGRGKHSFGDIYYSFSEGAADNSANGWFNVEADEYDLHLNASMNFIHDERSMTPEAAAKTLWSEVLGQAGISYD
ncbi:MAG: hypothetical protein KDJ83_12115 [Rhodobacteraceae bacterium]|nr:hypothetical protein [Paracoccaceae bacterium]